MDAKTKGFLENIKPNPVKRASYEKLIEIKKNSDENIELIEKKINTMLKIDDEEKRNIIVNLIAALDYYIHEIIIWGIVEITSNKFPKGKKYEGFLLSIKHIKNIFDNKNNLEKETFCEKELKKEIINSLKKKTYQKWKSIKEGLEHILPDDQLELISNLTTGGQGNNDKFDIEKLNSLNEKRDSIVHNCDRDYHNNSKKNCIDFDCKECCDYIILIINSIHKVISNYDKTKPEENEKEEDKEL